MRFVEAVIVFSLLDRPYDRSGTPTLGGQEGQLPRLPPSMGGGEAGIALYN